MLVPRQLANLCSLRYPRTPKAPHTAPVPPPTPHDASPPDRALTPLLRRFAAAAFGLLAGIAMNVLGATDLGPWVFLGSLALAVLTAHQIGRSGFDRPRVPARKAPRL
jgi:hypothetical protein